MKKITLFFIAFLALSISAFAQYSFPPVTGPTNVSAGAPVTLSINDAGNTAVVPASSTGSYSSFSISTDWVAAHLDDPAVRVVESNEDVLLYATGHVPGAVHADWQTDLQDPVTRDVISAGQFERLCSRLGIGPDTTVVFYGDKSNWWACYALWTFRLLGHADCRIMDGGRKKWIAEDRELTRDVPEIESVSQLD